MEMIATADLTAFLITSYRRASETTMHWKKTKKTKKTGRVGHKNCLQALAKPRRCLDMEVSTKRHNNSTSVVVELSRLSLAGFSNRGWTCIDA